jgi:tocopherol cyclase
LPEQFIEAIVYIAYYPANCIYGFSCMALKLYKPAVFQGNLKAKNYFEGWYFKQVSGSSESVYSFIPGISLTDDNPHAFIQVINGITSETHYIQYDLSKFSWNKSRFEIKIGSSEFSCDGIKIDINSDGLVVSGQVDFSGNVAYPTSFLSPGVMGWYSFVPFMECKHGVVSVSHRLSGTLLINKNKINFNGGKGYIEKDWGKSFPKAWLWLQCNTFVNSNASLMISIADIPWMGNYFLGLIAFLYIEGRFYLFNTYSKSTILKLEKKDNLIHIELESPSNKLIADVKKNRSGHLNAPHLGSMSRIIKESVDSEVVFCLKDKSGNIIFSDEGHHAGLEEMDAIFGYLKK